MASATLRLKQHPAAGGICLLFFCLLFSGCANFNSVFRTQNTDPNSMQTILIDAKQRPISINTVSDSRHPKFCLARSADALSQAAASGNLKIDQASSAGGSLGIASAEQVTSIAFRTQVTESEQEFLYYLCQLNSNGAISDSEVADNLRHFQNTMLAMVAIDDIASAAKASAPPAAAPANSATEKPDTPATPAPANAKAGELAAAQGSVDTAKNGVTKAGTSVADNIKTTAAATTTEDAKKKSQDLSNAVSAADGKEKTLATKIEALRTATAAAKGADPKPAEPDKVVSATKDVGTTAKDAAAASKDLKTAADNVGAATDADLKAAQATLKTASTAYTTADGKYVTALNTLAAELKAWGADKAAVAAKPKEAAKDQAAAATALPGSAAAITEIVKTIVWQSFITEKCLNGVFAVRADGKEVDKDLKAFCLEHLRKADEFRFEQLRASPNATAPQAPLRGTDEAGAYGKRRQ